MPVMVTSIATGQNTELATLASCCAPAAPSVADDSAVSLAAMFKALADPARVKIMAMLLTAEEVCACDAAAGIGKSAATTSHHLKLLKDAGLATSERRGTWVYYRAVPERLHAIRDALAPTR